MGAVLGRQNAAVEEAADTSNHHAYKYPPRSGATYFCSHFIMGGEKFETSQPESYLFGENADLNFLGSRPTNFPYPPPQASEPTKTLKSLVNIRRESVRFVRVPTEKLPSDKLIDGPKLKFGKQGSQEQVDGNVLCTGGNENHAPPPSLYNIEFTFDSDAKCAITIYYFCMEEVSPSGVTLIPREGLTSETYHYDKGINQFFSQPTHVFNPQLIPEDDLIYNQAKEQYPVAINMVVEEGNEDCRQSHTTICVIDHHPESNSYVLRALKQKIFVDGLCYLLQEIYGIENKAVNKSSIDEDLDDHGSECVICMSEIRDTLILPCRHLCLCNSCADSLRYQANNCPICRSPFRALLQIRAVQKGISAQHGMLHGNTSTAGEPAPDQHIPSGYIPVSLIEALNGPPQYVARSGRLGDVDGIDGSGITTISTDNHHKATSPLKPTSQRRQKGKKHVSTSTNTSEVGTTTSANAATAISPNQGLSVVEITDPESVVNAPNHNKKGPAANSPNDKADKGNAARNMPQEKLQIINERHSLKVPKHKRNSHHSNNNNSANSSSHSHSTDDVDDDSENEKLSPLLASGNKSKSVPLPTALDAATTDDNEDVDEEQALAMKTSSSCISLKKVKQNTHHLSSDLNANPKGGGDSEELQNSILSPLCPDRLKSAEKLPSAKGNASGSFKGGRDLLKKNLHKKSTSVGNIVGPTHAGSTGCTTSDLKGNVSSLPDMLDSPISANSASTRSSSDSYSSSSSTKQLLSSNPTPAAVNIIVDGDKSALQNAVNV